MELIAPIPPAPPNVLEAVFDDTPTFIIKPRDLGRLWAFYRGEMTKGRVRIETPILKPVGTRVELLVVHPSSQAEWVLEGSIATTNQNARGGRPVLEIELDHLGTELKAEFRNFVATGRGMIEEDISMSMEVPSAIPSAVPTSGPSVRPVNLDAEDVEMPPTVLAEPSNPPERPIEEEEFRYESVVIDLDNLGEEELRSGIIDPPPPLEPDEEATLDRDPDPQPPVLRTFQEDDEASEPTLEPHLPEVRADPILRDGLALAQLELQPLPELPPGSQPRLTNEHLFSAFFEEAAIAEEERRSLVPAPASIRLDRPLPLQKPISSSGPVVIDDLVAPKTGIRPMPSNGQSLRAMPPELPAGRPPPPPPLPTGDEPFAPLSVDPEMVVVRGAPAGDEPIGFGSDPQFGEVAPSVRGVEHDDVAQNPPVPPGTMFEYDSAQAQAESPVLVRSASRRPPPLPPSARRRAIKETAGVVTPMTHHQTMSTEGTNPDLDRDIALARARMVRSPNSVTACYRLSTLLMRRGDRDNFDDALNTLLRVMEMEPNHPGAHHKLAEVFARRGEYVQASEHLSRARRLGYRTDPDLEVVVANGVKRFDRT